MVYRVLSIVANVLMGLSLIHISCWRATYIDCAPGWHRLLKNRLRTGTPWACRLPLAGLGEQHGLSEWLG